MTIARSIDGEMKTIRLSDGRALGYAEYGDTEAKALFYFHGQPGSRIEARFLAEQAGELGLRLIGVDRPGIGLSSYQPGRRLVDWPADVVELADCLHIDRFAVVGYSAGGAYALACAQLIPERLTACGIVSGAGSPGDILAFLLTWVTWLGLPFVRLLFRNEAQARALLKRVVPFWPNSDRKTVSLPSVIEVLAISLVEALKPGTWGTAYDGVLVDQSWGFKLKEIAFPSIYLWHGELDQEVSIRTIRALVGQLAHCQASYLPGEGHISLLINHAGEILKSLS